jgi:plasmid stabilization system protein ParE
MTPEFSPGAIQDIDEAAFWYAKRDFEFAEDFEQRLRAALQDVLVDPSRFPVDPESPARKGVRVALLKRFPYKLLFVCLKDGIYIIGVSHTSRHPRHWRRRL